MSGLVLALPGEWVYPIGRMPSSVPHAAPALLSALLVACASTSPVAKSAPAGPASPAPQLEKMREPLEVTPLELHFSGLRGSAGGSESVSIKNASDQDTQVSDIRVVGTDATTFKVTGGPLLPVVLLPGKSFSFSVTFEPAADAEPGVHHARVRIVRTEDDDGPPCDLTGLVSRGTTPSDEPTLQQILEALGYAVDVGSKALNLPAKPPLLGDEIEAPLFVRAKPGTVGYYLIARYTADEASSFGYYVLGRGKPVTKPIGGAAKGHNRTLNPELEAESQTSFDADETTFGLFLEAGKQRLYSDDGLNGATHAHAARVFPLRSRGRTPVQDAYVVAFDEDGDGDFQDHVFMLWNAKPARD
jgi:hypothetical protein